MHDTRLRIAAAFVALALVMGILTLIFWDFVRDAIVIPIYYSVWVGGLFLNSIPQAALLALLLVICAGVGLSALAASLGGRTRRRHAEAVAQVETRYRHWERMCANLYLSRFSRQLFTAEARRLILSVLAFEYRLDTGSVDALVRNGQLDLPDSIRRLLDGDEDLLPERSLSRMDVVARRLRGEPVTDPQVEALLSEIIAFMETRLEIVHVGNPSEFIP